MVYDGMGNRLVGFTFRYPASWTGEREAGLFASLEWCELKHIQMVDSMALGSETAGLLAGTALNTKVEECGAYVDTIDPTTGLMYADLEQRVARYCVSATQSGSSVGGLIGRGLGNTEIQASFAAVAVNGTGNAGGLIGQMQRGTIQASYASGLVSVTGTAGKRAGGQIGRAPCRERVVRLV